MNIRILSLLAVLPLFGCAAAAESDHGTEDPVGEAEQALVAGTWVAPPGNGVVIGYSGGRGPLDVCRSPYDNGQQPGKLWEGQCNFGFGGKEVRLSNYTLLLDAGYTWKNPGGYVYDGDYADWQVSLPTNAVDGGDAGTISNHVRLGVCQAWRSEDNTWHPGKFFKNNCNIAWGGKEIVVAPTDNGEVLVLVK